jgi:hypothetical protein
VAEAMADWTRNEVDDRPRSAEAWGLLAPLLDQPGLHVMLKAVEPRLSHRVGVFPLRHLAEAFRAAEPRLAPEDARRFAAGLRRSLILGLADAGTPAELRRLALVFGALEKHLDRQAVVDLLKMPTCVGPMRRAILDRLGREAGRTFNDIWAFEDWARRESPTLLLLDTPRRPES